MLTAKLGFSFSLSDLSDTLRMGAAADWQGSISELKTLSDGVLAGSADLGYLAQRQIASNANDDIDLAGVLLTALGETFSAAKLVALVIWNRPRLASDAANTTNLTVGGGSNPMLGFLGGTTPTIGPIKPGGFLILGADHIDGIGAVAPGTGDILRIANSSGAVNNYVLGLLGRSA